MNPNLNNPSLLDRPATGASAVSAAAAPTRTVARAARVNWLTPVLAAAIALLAIQVQTSLAKLNANLDQITVALEQPQFGAKN
jgi:hypothetical protein